MAVLKGSRIRLRSTGLDDLNFLRKLWNDGEVMCYVGFPQGLGIDKHGMIEWFKKLKRHRGVDREHWIIENGQGRPIGEAYYKAEREYYGYRAEKMAQVDIKLARCFWDHGYATDALRTLIRHLLGKGFETIVVSPNLANEAALKLYGRLGFEPKNRFWSEETRAEHQVWALAKDRA
jgi:RimJ/RimL family protein N-acetyltransferase